ncbi:DivIVA domain-containing protein [Anoxybacterium hadale]|uniref:DivIVA domain-containing protein n=1 Tax=Anoxybacterium hadale TaxID=3408580 RepID=A0ACD1A825_9FIRM|nr:DivIVA domain-containing protein [Clostridiales bacterium]
MITPLDIQNKEFAKAVRGYKEEDVDSFLDLLTLDLEKLLEENRRLKDQAKSLNAEVERYRNSEGAVLETLEAAKALMGDISASAEKRAEILLKNAELDAELIQREAKESVERLNEEMISTRNRLNIFRTRYRSLLESELEKFDNLSAELFADKVIEELKPYTEERPVSIEKRSFGKETITNLRKGEGV